MLDSEMVVLFRWVLGAEDGGLVWSMVEQGVCVCLYVYVYLDGLLVSLTTAGLERVVLWV